MLRCEAQGNCADVFYIFLSCLCKFRSQKYTTLPGLVIQGQPSLKPEQIGIMVFQNLLILHMNAVWSQNNCCAFGWILICCYSSCLSIHCQNRTHLIVYKACKNKKCSLWHLSGITIYAQPIGTDYAFTWVVYFLAVCLSYVRKKNHSLHLAD